LTGFVHSGVRKSDWRFPSHTPPCRNLLAFSERIYGEYQHCIDNAGSNHEWWDGRWLDAEQIAVEGECEVVDLAAEEQQPEIDVVVRQQIPGPERAHRQTPKDKNISHRVAASADCSQTGFCPDGRNEIRKRWYFSSLSKLRFSYERF
jgi:hypothetical protein